MIRLLCNLSVWCASISWISYALLELLQPNNGCNARHKVLGTSALAIALLAVLITQL